MKVIAVKKTNSKTSKIRSDWRITQSIRKYKTVVRYLVYLDDGTAKPDAKIERVISGGVTISYTSNVIIEGKKIAFLEERRLTKAELSKLLKELGQSEVKIHDRYGNKVIGLAKAKRV